MRVILYALAIAMIVTILAEDSEARRRRFFFRRSCNANYTYSNNYYAQPAVYSGDAYASAQARANSLAAKGYGHHFALPCNGATKEGWGFGPTPQAALNSCCWFGTGIAAQATAYSPASGGYYAIRLYW